MMRMPLWCAWLCAAMALLAAVQGGGAKGSGGGGGKISDVVELTDANFDRLVLHGGGGEGSVDAWIVGFFAPWCGHCQRLQPEWEAAAAAVRKQTGGRVRLGAVDATVHLALAGRYDIRGYPTIKIFRAGADSSAEPEDYRGGRTRGEIAAKAAELLVETPPPPPPLSEIVDEDTFRKACDERPLCVVAVLPHVLDSGAAGRNAYLDLVRNAAANHHRRRASQSSWGWLWAEAGAQPALEAALGVRDGAGYPVMAAVNTRKARAAVLRGSFGERGIGEFLAELRAAGGAGHNKGGSAAASIPVAGFTVPEIHPVQPWDGKDGQLPPVEEEEEEEEEEEYDVSNAEL